MGGGGGQADSSQKTDTTTQSYADSFNKTVNLVANISTSEAFYLSGGAPASSGASDVPWSADTAQTDGGFLGFSPTQLLIGGAVAVVALVLLVRE